MKPLWLLPALLGVLLDAPPAAAWDPLPWLPAPENSTVPAHVVVTGRLLSQPDDENGSFTVIVRNRTNHPIFGSLVIVDLAGAPDVRMASSSLIEGTTVDCSHHTIRRLTDNMGLARFTIMGVGRGAISQPGPVTAYFYADGITLGAAPVSVLDLDGANGVSANDLSLWLSDFGAAMPSLRGDYDGNGALGANDLSVWLTAAGAGGSSESATPNCP